MSTLLNFHCALVAILLQHFNTYYI